MSRRSSPGKRGICRVGGSKLGEDRCLAERLRHFFYPITHGWRYGFPFARLPFFQMSQNVLTVAAHDLRHDLGHLVLDRVFHALPVRAACHKLLEGGQWPEELRGLLHLFGVYL